MDVETLAKLLRETAEQHDRFEKAYAEHHWWDWYAPYMSVRQQGGTPEEAAAAADRHMEEVHRVLPLTPSELSQPPGTAAPGE